AIRINPSHAAAHATMAHLLCFVGHPSEALHSVERALRLSPFDPRLGLWLPAKSQAEYFRMNYLEAAAVAQQAITMIPSNPLAWRFAAASLGQLGKKEKAEPILQIIRASGKPSLNSVRTSVSQLYND